MNDKKMMQIVGAVQRTVGDDKKSFWTRIGTAFQNKDGSWNLRFDYLPARLSDKMCIRDSGYTGPVDRLLIRDLSSEAVRRQLRALEPNSKYRPLSEAALARQRADWLYGINMTRLYTLLGRAAGYDGVLSVGRVQTPLLGLIVARDAAIAGFRSAAYYVVAAEVRAGGGERFRAFWVPPEGVPLDEDRRLLGRDVAEAACQRVVGQAGRIAACTEETRTETPPLPYSLADLQMDAGRRHGMTATEVLDACQSLYETHRLLTYPRSDCAYLPEGQRAQAKDVLAAVAHHAPTLAPAAHDADLTLRSRAWNDQKVSAHHAIIPTPVSYTHLDVYKRQAQE